MVRPSPPAKSSPTGWFEPCATMSEPESPEALNGTDRRDRELVDEVRLETGEADGVGQREVADVDVDVDRVDRSGRESGRTPVLLDLHADGRGNGRRARRPIAVREGRRADIAGGRQRDRSVDRVRAPREVDLLVVGERGDTVVRVDASVLNRAGLEDVIPDARLVDPGEDMVVRERIDVRAVRHPCPERSRRERPRGRSRRRWGRVAGSGASPSAPRSSPS